MPTPIASDDIVAFLRLPRYSSSVYGRPYLRKLYDGQTLVEWTCRRFLAANPGLDLYVLGCGREDFKLLEQTLCALGPGVRVAESSPLPPLQQLAQLAGYARLDVILVDLEHGLAPSSVVRQALQVHADSGATYTQVVGLPTGTAPQIFQLSLVHLLGDLLPGPVMSDLNEALSALARVPAELLHQLGVSIRTATFDAAQSAGIPPPGGLPISVQLRSPVEADLAAETIAGVEAGHGGDDDWAYLRAWRVTKARLARERLTRLPSVARTDGADSGSLLFVNGSTAFSGAEQAQARMIQALGQQGYDVGLLSAFDGPVARDALDVGASVSIVGWDFTAGTAENYLFSLDILARKRPAILHLNGLAGAPLLAAARYLRIPIVQHVRTLYVEPFEEYTNAAAGVIAPSAAIGGELSRLGDHTSTITRIIYDWIDPSDLDCGDEDQTSVRRSLGIPPESRLAVMVARFSPPKRHDVLIQAAALLRQEVPSFRLLLVGEPTGAVGPEEYARAMALIRSLDLTDAVFEIPFVKNIVRVLRAADVVVLCSEREGFGLCVIEAMTLGRPVVVAGSGGFDELVRDGVTGFHAPLEPRALADAMKMALDYSPSIAQMIARARVTVAEKCDMTVSVARLVELYESILGRPVLRRSVPSRFSRRGGRTCEESCRTFEAHCGA